MIDRIFFATYAFCLLAGAALVAMVLSSDPFGGVPATGDRATVRFVQLPDVQVIGKRSTLASTVARTDAGAAGSPRAQ